MGTGVTLLLWPPGNLVSGVPLARLLYGERQQIVPEHFVVKELRFDD